SAGGEMVRTTSQPHTSAGLAGISAPACTKAASGSKASAPAPFCTTTSKALAFSLLTTPGTSATRGSPAAVSFGTPIRTCRAGTYPIAARSSTPAAGPATLARRRRRSGSGPYHHQSRRRAESSHDRKPHPHLHQARRRRRDAPRRHEPGVQAAPARGGLRHGG